MDMAREELGLVWMGDMLLQSDPMMLDHQPEPPYFAEPQTSLDDMRSRSALCMDQPYQHEIEGFMMLGEFDDPYCTEVNDPGGKFGQVNTAATQTAQEPRSRKIKPIKHPGLKLQTPIAYQRDTDPSVIPIQRDGMAVCEKCGAIGVKHAFYTKERRFCSMNCVRGAAEMDAGWQPTDGGGNGNTQLADEKPLLPPVPHWVEQMSYQPQIPVHMKLELDYEKLPPVPPPPPAPLVDDTPFPPDRARVPELAGSYDWTPRLNDPGFVAAPVSCFDHAPMSDCWDNITTGMKVEVENFDCENFSEDFPNSFWVATVLKVFGYKAQLRYEGFGSNPEKDFWVNLCASSVHPVGWCATRGKPLIPPRTIEDKYRDWKDFLVKRLTGARTLPSNFFSKVHDSMRSRFRCDLNLEVVDKDRICQVKVATIKKIVGKRLHIRYYDLSAEESGGFWCHEDSPLIHPVGWARRVGQTIDAPPAYLDRCGKGLRDKDDATEDLFPLPPYSPVNAGYGFREGMKLEAVDPLNLSAISVTTVMKVLHEGYIMVRVDSYDDRNGADWFCYHSSSPYIFPAGFCASRGLPLSPPVGWDAATFSWAAYLQATGAHAAPLDLFNMDVPDNGFNVGMKVECVDLMAPHLVCVATISKVVARLLKVHFDGWDDDYDQWLDCCSPDVYPVGWCQLVAHRLEPPQAPPPLLPPSAASHSAGKAGRRKRRRVGATKRPPPPPAAPAPPAKLPSPPAEYDWLADPTPDELMDTSQPEAEEEEEEEEEEVTPERLLPLPDLVPQPPPPDPPVQLLPPPPPPPPPPTTAPAPPPPTPIVHMPARVAAVQTFERSPVPAATVNPNNVNGWSQSLRVIPRLIDPPATFDSRELAPLLWSVEEAAEFLRVNDCGAYTDSFKAKNVTGANLLSLTKDEIMDLTGMKVGPSLKIENLITQLKIKVNPAHERMKQAAGLKKLL